MNSLSVILKSSGQCITRLINNLSQVLQKGGPELVLVNNALDSIDIDLKYKIERFRGEYKDFIDYVFSIATGERILLLDEDYYLSRNDIDILVDLLQNNSKNSYVANFKVYLDDSKNNFFQEKRPLVYYRDAKNQNNLVIKEVPFMVEDYSLLSTREEDMWWNISRLIEEDHIKELATLYKNYFSLKDSIHKKFCNLLERKKAVLDLEKSNLISEEFLKTDIENNYIKFLKLKQLFNDNPSKAIQDTLDFIKSTSLAEDDLYFSYLLKDAFEKKDYVIEILSELDYTSQKAFLKELLKENPNFYLSFYNFMVSIDIAKETGKRNNPKVKTYKDILKIYIETMSDDSYEIHKKAILNQLFVDYCNYAIYHTNERMRKNKNIFLNSETKFIIEADKAIGMINNKDIDSAILILKNAAKGYPLMSRAVDLQAQKLKLENENFDYRISICMIVKDEEKNLGRCLSSLKPLIDCGLAELIIVDTGSTDKTVDIAKQFTDKVYFQKWENNFSKARNYSISLANGEYLMIMDADEEIEAEEIKKLIEFFTDGPYDKYNTFTRKLKNFSDKTLTQYSIFTQPFIFKNDGSFYYFSSVHNQPVFKKPIKNLDIEVLHYGYIMTDDIVDKKFNRTASLLKKELEKDPNNIYYRYQLSVSYSMHGDSEDALEQVEIYMKQLDKEDEASKKYIMAYGHAAKTYLSNSLYDKTLKTCNKILKTQPDYIDAIYYKAVALFNKKMFKNAIYSFKEYLDLEKDFFKYDIAHNTSLSFYTLHLKVDAQKAVLGAYHNLEQFEDCIRVSWEMEESSAIKGSLGILIESFIKTKRYDELAKFYREKIAVSGDLKIYFVYILKKFIQEYTKEEKDTIINKLKKVEDSLASILKRDTSEMSEDDIAAIIRFLTTVNLDEIDNIAAGIFSEPIMKVLSCFDISLSKSPSKLYVFKECARFILHRTLNLEHLTGLSEEELLDILTKYIKSCSKIISIKRDDLLDKNEKDFTNYMLEAFEKMEENNVRDALKLIKKSILNHREMAKPIALFLKTISYKGKENIVKEDELHRHAYAIKQQLESFINGGLFEEAKKLIVEYEKIIPNDPEIYSMKSIVLIQENKIKQAEETLKKGLQIAPKDGDLLFNLAYLYEVNRKYELAIRYYKKAKKSYRNKEIVAEIENAIKRLKTKKVRK